MSTTTDILFISHGGGPLPLLGDPEHRDMVNTLKVFAGKLARPAAMLVISAHWEARVPTVTSGACPELIYDYYGFPPEAYSVRYPCPGEPRLAQQVVQALEKAGIPAGTDQRRGLDHGVFVPLQLMYPEADIPCVQLSLVDSLDAGLHIAIGRTLRSLDYDNLLVIGSGFSFHNMRAFFAPQTPEMRAANLAFENWLEDTCAGQNMDENERQSRLIDWESAPHARFCHPREEHLLPLHVCYGLAGKACDEHVSATILGKRSGMFYWHVKAG
ncbi:class III extradiol ring-cleavage dioxygenase [Oceanimonas pelagia]|uniref:Class III extradiol ring-cleavage dioxygenase n=1 Tax=Oceanimonas pelagia TaxID=3028314 RepID=A0AA50QAW4_9GAMM|nr:class III extradiol ring-cleavage dioxygenase [Oceanimonas pelagia]WMC11468.1 class III extradiol ring-cleavage dioxygenase [Oceanimonas pelagia]